jgi:hypothetical protein
MSFISELEENEELVEFEETWAELVKIEAIAEIEEEYVSDTVSDYMNHGV